MPVPTPAPPIVPEATSPAPVLELTLVEVTPQVEPPIQLEPEEPTTVQAPVWDDEPHPDASQVTSDGWITSTSEVPATNVPVEVEESAPPMQVESDQATAIPQVSLQKAESPIIPPAKSVTPLSYARPSSTHRVNSRFKNSDQAVVMPTTNFGTPIEKIGMMFGSVTLGGDDLSDPLYVLGLLRKLRDFICV